MNILRVDNFFPPSIAHGFFGRQGGVSTGLYESLNCSYQSRDLAEHIVENRARVLKSLGGEGLSTLCQIHSDICFPLENACMTGAEEGDALVTRTKGQVIGCLTADCGPVLFYGEDSGGGPVIGAAHAGWGGALKGVLESTITAMVNMGANLNSIKAALGPCLAQENYEVGAEFREPFVKEDKGAGDFFCYPPTQPSPLKGEGGTSFPSPLRGEGQDGGGERKESKKLLFNLPAYIDFRLKRAGIQHIFIANKDTYANPTEYFSYRRATHAGDPDYGRQISCIMIKD